MVAVTILNFCGQRHDQLYSSFVSDLKQFNIYRGILVELRTNYKISLGDVYGYIRGNNVDFANCLNRAKSIRLYQDKRYEKIKLNDLKGELQAVNLCLVIVQQHHRVQDNTNGLGMGNPSRNIF